MRRAWAHACFLFAAACTHPQQSALQRPRAAAATCAGGAPEAAAETDCGWQLELVNRQLSEPNADLNAAEAAYERAKTCAERAWTYDLSELSQQNPFWRVRYHFAKVEEQIGLLDRARDDLDYILGHFACRARSCATRGVDPEMLADVFERRAYLQLRTLDAANRDELVSNCAATPALDDIARAEELSPAIRRRRASFDRLLCDSTVVETSEGEGRLAKDWSEVASILGVAPTAGPSSPGDVCKLIAAEGSCSLMTPSVVVGHHDMRIFVVMRFGAGLQVFDSEAEMAGYGCQRLNVASQRAGRWLHVTATSIVGSGGNTANPCHFGSDSANGGPVDLVYDTSTCKRILRTIQRDSFCRGKPAPSSVVVDSSHVAIRGLCERQVVPPA